MNATRFNPSGISILVNLCKEGDGKAFRELYGRYAKAMLNISFRIVNDRALAEDILQESFLKAFKNISGFDQKASFGSWLKRIVVNGSIDELRKQKAIYQSIDDFDIVEEGPVDEPEYNSMDMEMIRKCIGMLPEGYRVILTLFLLEDYTHKEIAEMVNISEGTSKSQYSRAKAKLKEIVLTQLRSNEQ